MSDTFAEKGNARWYNDIGFDLIHVNGESRMPEAVSDGETMQVPGVIEIRVNRAAANSRLEHFCLACDRAMDCSEGDDDLALDPAAPGGRWRETLVICPGCGLSARFRWCG